MMSIQAEAPLVPAVHDKGSTSHFETYEEDESLLKIAATDKYATEFADF